MCIFGFDGFVLSFFRMARSSVKSRATRGEISYVGIVLNNVLRLMFCLSNIVMC